MNWVIFSAKDFTKEFVLRSRRASPSLNPFLTPGTWVAGREVSVVESFCELEMCGDIKDCLLVKSFAFENSGIQEVYFFVWDFSRKFNCRVVTVC